jgi:hypothetical protein
VYRKDPPSLPVTAFLPLSRAQGFEATEERFHGGKEQQVLSYYGTY